MKETTAPHLKPYRVYREAGIDWLQEVPEHWVVVPLGKTTKGVANGIWGDEPNGEDDIVCIRVADFDRHRWRVSLGQLTTRAVNSKERHRRLLRKGDLLLEKSGGGERQPVGVAVLFDHDFEAVCSNFIARMPVSEICIPHWLIYLHALLYSIGLNRRSIKQTTGIQNLDAPSFFGEYIPLPPMSEQKAIARFLDWMDDRVTRLVEAKERLVMLLEELRASTIAATVTGRIDVRTGQPYPAYRPSDIDWLGRIPAHWELAPFKRIAQFKSGVGFPVNDQGKVGQKLLFLKVSDMNLPGNEQLIRGAANTVSPKVANTLGAHVFGRDTILFPKVGGALLTNKRRILTKDACIDNNIMACVVIAADVWFTYYLMLWLDLGGMAKPGPVPAISEGEVKNVRIPLPPPTEQVAIAQFLGVWTAKTDAAISNMHREIELLQAYRTRMISDVVTGKCDVREATHLLEENAA
ncbi:MAG: restriction endonuclease subunit S [bacterium]|nr:restriction endonuclease subunit S [bacterium]MDE0602428.1 restriction endonuclease subunit S [bacterium]